MRQRDEEAAKIAAQENERQMKLELDRSNMEREHNEKVTKMKDRVEDFLAKYEEDAAAVERRFERLERAAAQRRIAVDLEQSKWSALWNEKHQNADKMIAELEQKLRESESASALKTKLAELQTEHEELQRKIKEEQDEIAHLSEGPGSERDILEEKELQN